MDHSQQKTVYVSNIAPPTNTPELISVFSFCGGIDQIRFVSGEPTSEASITFDSTMAASTAVLLNNAIMSGKQIKVSYNPTPALSTAKNQPPTTSSTTKLESSQSPQRSKKVSAATETFQVDDEFPQFQELAATTIIVDSLCPTVTDIVFVKFFQFCEPIKRYSLDRSSKSAMVEFPSKIGLRVAAHMDGAQLGKLKIKVNALFQYQAGALPPYVSNLIDQLMEPIAYFEDSTPEPSLPPPLPPRKDGAPPSNAVHDTPSSVPEPKEPKTQQEEPTQAQVPILLPYDPLPTVPSADPQEPPREAPEKPPQEPAQAQEQ